MFIKIIFLLFGCFLFLHSYSQCNDNALLKRDYKKYKSSNDKIVNIRATALNDRGIIRENLAEIKEMKRYIETSLNIPKKPNIASYMSACRLFKKDFPVFKIDETAKLDKMVYCFINFLESKLEKIKRVIENNNNARTVAVKINSIYNEIDKEGSPQMVAIDKELRRLDAKYQVSENK